MHNYRNPIIRHRKLNVVPSRSVSVVAARGYTEDFHGGDMWPARTEKGRPR